MTADHSGLVIGLTQLPIVHQGDALFHVARFEDVGEVAQQVEDFQAAHQGIESAPQACGALAG